MNQMRPSSPQGGTGFSLLDSHVGMSQNSVPKTTQGLFMVTQYYLLVIKRGKSPNTEVPMGIMMNGGLLGFVVILSDYSMFPMGFPIIPWVFHRFPHFSMGFPS